MRRKPGVLRAGSAWTGGQRSHYYSLQNHERYPPFHPNKMSTPPPFSPQTIQVVLVDPGNKDKSLSKAERVRAFWYVMLVALEDEETQRRGVCILVSLKRAKLSLVSDEVERVYSFTIFIFEISWVVSSMSWTPMH